MSWETETHGICCKGFEILDGHDQDALRQVRRGIGKAAKSMRRCWMPWKRMSRVGMTTLTRVNTIMQNYYPELHAIGPCLGQRGFPKSIAPVNDVICRQDPDPTRCLKKGEFIVNVNCYHLASGMWNLPGCSCWAGTQTWEEPGAGDHPGNT